MIMHVQFLCWHIFSFLLVVYVGKKLLGYIVSICCSLLRSCQTDFQSGIPFYISTRMYKDSNFSTSSPNLNIICLFDYSHPREYEEVSQFRLKKIFFLIYFIHLVFILFLGALGLRCCMHAFSSCGERELLSSRSVWVSHRSGSSCCGALALKPMGLSSCGTRAQEHRLRSCGAQA